MSKGLNITKRILEVITDGLISTAALSLAIIGSGYGASYKKMQRSMDEIERELRRPLIDPAARKARQRFYAMLSKLKRDGLIEKKPDGWIVTAIGKMKLAANKKKLPSGEYGKEPDNLLKIIIFDIPEKQRRKRDWLRRKLLDMGFKMLQRSVWAGKVKIPPEFISDLRNIEILNYIDIFEVTKTGSLRHI